MSGGKNDITKELVYKDGKYSITLTDKNGVLSDYSFSSSDGNVKVSRSGDKLTISICRCRFWLCPYHGKAKRRADSQ